MSLQSRRIVLIVSIILLTLIGHLIARRLSSSSTAWIYVTAFYGLWIIFSLMLVLEKTDLKVLFQSGRNNFWYFIPALLSIPVFIFIFIPNIRVIRFDFLFVLNIFICLVNPWMEELYWRGSVCQLFRDSPVISFLLSAIGFGLSHPLVFGINSPGIAGIPGFLGAFMMGSVWWFCLRKTSSLRGCVLTHFLIDSAGLAAYVLADKLELMKLPI